MKIHGRKRITYSRGTAKMTCKCGAQSPRVAADTDGHASLEKWSHEHKPPFAH